MSGSKSESWEHPLTNLVSTPLVLSLKHIHLIYTTPAIVLAEPSKKPTKDGALTTDAGLTVLLNIKESWDIPSLTKSAHFEVWLLGIAASQDFLEERVFLSWVRRHYVMSNFNLMV